MSPPPLPQLYCSSDSDSIPRDVYAGTSIVRIALKQAAPRQWMPSILRETTDDVYDLMTEALILPSVSEEVLVVLGWTLKTNITCTFRTVRAVHLVGIVSELSVNTTESLMHS